MKAKYRNLFILFGLAAIVIMLLSFDMDYAELWANICRAGYWFIGVVGIWVLIYFFNTVSWFYIIRNGERPSPVPFWRVYKLSISGFALNYATPGGLMGGEPYRIMELAPVLGTARATSSVILYVMMHIFSHICFWLVSLVLFVCLRPVSLPFGIVLAVVAVLLLAGIYFFMQGYKNGMVVKTFQMLQHIPFAKNWAKRFYAAKQEDLQRIDHQIAELHNQKRKTFNMSFLFEFTARFLTCGEIFFILKILTPEVNLLDCIFIMAFTSLFSNIFFFSPMQIGAREGGFALAVSGLAMSGAFGVYASLITRIRELVWIVVGVLLMRFGNLRKDPFILKNKKVRGLLFDYGGTLDSGGRHWASVIWEAYSKNKVPVTEPEFREAYVYAERFLAANPVIKPEDNFLTLMQKKIRIEMEHLQEMTGNSQLLDKVEAVATYCYDCARQEVKKSTAVLQTLAARYPLVLVTNFYGNMHAVLKDFGLDRLFKAVVESSVVGVRKPNPQIWKLGVEALGMQPAEVCAVGDSFGKDIEAAKSLGCRTVWFKGGEWKPEPHDESLPDAIITDISQLIKV